jgi:hypothetical protein
VLAAGHGTYEVRTLPALPFEEFLGVVDELRPSEDYPTRSEYGLSVRFWLIDRRVLPWN